MRYKRQKSFEERTRDYNQEVLPLKEQELPYRKRALERNKVNSSFSVIKLVLLILIIFSVLFSIFNSTHVYGFRALLDTIQQVPSADIKDVFTMLNIDLISKDWGIMNGLRDFINYALKVLNTGLSFATYVGFGFAQLVSLISIFFSSILG